MSASVWLRSGFAGGVLAANTSIALGTLALLVMAIRFPPDDLLNWMTRSTGLQSWEVLALVTLMCVVGLVLAGRDPGTRRGTVASYVNAIVGLLALLATAFSAISVNGVAVWLTVSLLAIAWAASTRRLRRSRQETG